MNRLDQDAEQNRFVWDNGPAIQRARDCVIRACTAWLKANGSTLPAGHLRIAQEALDCRKEGDFVQVVRAYATSFNHHSYWHVIDACNNLQDALGTHWPYLTQDGRQRHLKWATEEAQMLSGLLMGSPDDLRSCTEPGLADLTDDQATEILYAFGRLGYTELHQVPGPVWQQQIRKAKGLENPSDGHERVAKRSASPSMDV